MLKENQNSKKNNQKRQVESIKKPGQTSKIIFCVSVVIAICIVGFIAYFSGFLTSARISIESGSIRQEQAKSRRTIEQSSDTEQANRVELLYKAGVIDNKVATYSAKVDSCGFISKSKNTWTVVNWSERCSLRYVDIAETSLTRDEIFQKLSKEPLISSVFGVPRTLNITTRGGTCDEIYSLSYNPTLYFLDWSRGNNLSCSIFDPATGQLGLAGSTSHAIKSYNVSDVKADMSYLTISHDYPYFTKSLGCGQKGLFGCESPIKEPITDFDNK